MTLTSEQKLARKASKPAHDGRLCRKCGEAPGRQGYNARSGGWVYTWCQRCKHASANRTGSHARTRLPAAKRAGRWGGNVYASLSPAEWGLLYAFQDGRCACCQRLLIDRYDREASELLSAEVAQLDHSHQVEAELIAAGADPLDALRSSVRGLLCKMCNHVTLPRLGHNPDFAQRIADHLRNFVAQQFIAQEAPDGIRAGTGSVPPRIA